MFADFTAKNIFYILPQDDGSWTTGTIISDGSVTVFSFAEDVDGELLIIGQDNEVYFLPCGDLCEEDPTENSILYSEVGCYVDETDRIFSGNFLLRYQELTTEFCADFCRGSAYFGTQYGEECWCGEATDDPTVYGNAVCNWRCVGDTSQACGARWAMSVYEYTYTS